jgi:hypothetical protein
MSIDISARAADVGVDVAFGNFNLGAVRFLPQRVALIGQGNTAETYVLDKYSVTSYGCGSLWFWKSSSFGFDGTFASE